MFCFKRLGNTRLPHLKGTAGMPAVSSDTPAEVLLPMSQHIGAPAIPVVKVGDEVRVGQKIAEADGPVSSPVHASVSGKVKKMESILLSNGRTVSAVRIESDGLMTRYEDIKAPSYSDLDGFLAAVRESGLVGLGGAGFPTAVKLGALGSGKIDTLVINGAECEPYITGDTRTMLDDTARVIGGIKRLQALAPSLKCVIGIEKNKKECIVKLREATANDSSVSVVALPDTYPQGAEKVLIYNTTRRTVPEGKLPSDVGVIVMNVTSIAFLDKYFEDGMPLVSRTVTFDGSAVASPKNITVPIGTLLCDLIELSGGLSSDAGKVLFGGPMMGNAAASLEEPIIKTTGAVTVLSVKDSLRKEPSACIHCGRCIATCPHKLDPVGYSKALEIEDKAQRMERLGELKINLCIECGSCSFVCPANRPLVQNNRLAKGELRDYMAHHADLKK